MARYKDYLKVKYKFGTKPKLYESLIAVLLECEAQGIHERTNVEAAILTNKELAIGLAKASKWKIVRDLIEEVQLIRHLFMMPDALLTYKEKELRQKYREELK